MGAGRVWCKEVWADCGRVFEACLQALSTKFLSLGCKSNDTLGDYNEGNCFIETDNVRIVFSSSLT